MPTKKINLLISNKCFIQCYGCYYDRTNKEEIDLLILNNFLSFARLYGLNKITISGGDPLTCKKLLDILNICYKLGLKINLDTVGTPFYKNCHIFNNSDDKILQIKDLKPFKNIEFLGIPLDGSSDKIISDFRYIYPGFFNEQLNIIEKLSYEGLNVCINTVLHKKNAKDIKNILNIINRFPLIKKWQIFQYMPIGVLGKLKESEFSINNETFNQIAEIIKQKNQIENLQIDFKNCDERNHNYLLINADGDVYKVNIDNTKIFYGNIKNKKSWDNIITNL